MKSLGNVIYRMLNSDDIIEYSNKSGTESDLSVAEDGEEYKDKKE